MGFGHLDLSQGRIRHIAEKRFTLHKAKLRSAGGNLLHDQPRPLPQTAHFDSVSNSSDRNRPSDAMVTSRWDLRAIVVAHRMFERWRQEISSVPRGSIDRCFAIIKSNPTTHTSIQPGTESGRERGLRCTCSSQETAGKLWETAIDYINSRTSTDSGFAIAEEKIAWE